jgi:Na+/H+ antiporter NhaD/arsenite permease-like protein
LLRKSTVRFNNEMDESPGVKGAGLVLAVGIGGLVMVPVFKTLTHLPPYLGILFILGLIWALTERIHKAKSKESKSIYTPSHALAKIDTPSILFFLGILLAVSALETTHILQSFALQLDRMVGNRELIVIFIGLASAVVDNVPLVAASIGMYDLNHFPLNDPFWIFLAYAAGTGGSILIIGSAAGVAVMGMEKIDFMWYAKRISLLALSGYLAGAVFFVAFQ